MRPCILPVRSTEFIVFHKRNAHKVAIAIAWHRSFCDSVVLFGIGTAKNRWQFCANESICNFLFGDEPLSSGKITNNEMACETN